MRLVDFITLVDNTSFTETATFRRIDRDLRDAIDHVRWPPNGPDFAIYPESGKQRNMGNGVKPIKKGFQALLSQRGWQLEQRYPGVQDELRPGAFDAWVEPANGFSPFVLEWETGNISSSHRALNKMATGLQEGILSGGILILPTRRLYRYLTDRIGNFDELKPYFKFWSSMPVRGFLAVVSVEHDRESLDVPRIPKGTDGRAIG
jgi:Restriction endonuclease BamHI